MDTELPGREVHDERRWYPTDDPEKWAATGRQEMFDAVRHCVAEATRVPVRRDALAHEVYSADEVFRQVRECVQSCARALYALGQDDARIVRMVRAAQKRMAQPDELHPAVLEAMAQWCRDAHDV